MNAAPSRILLVDDDPLFVRAIARGLNHAFPDTPVDCAKSINDGNSLLKSNEGSITQPLYDVVILDFKLPSIGGAALVDVSLCKEARLKNRDSLVIHVTGWPDDPKVCSHLEEDHGIVALQEEADLGEQRLHRGVCFKKDVHIMPRIVAAIRAHMQLQQVVARLERLLGQCSTVGRPSPIGRASGFSLTGEIASLTRDLGSVWSQLPAKYRHLVLQHLKVHEEGDSVRISVL